jgi:tRNA-splicing ligase RtcB
MPFIAGHIALMPDAHFGLGATVGSVIPTDNAIMPAAVGVDIGCGMIAVATSLTAAQLPDDLSPYLSQVEQVVPAGVGQGHAEATKASDDFFALHPPFFSDSLLDRARRQFGSLGSGNHFFEVCLDESDGVWVVLHSGSRGVGNQLAQRHINTAKARVKAERIDLEDPDLAYFEQGSDDFAAYIADMMWCQDYARANRDAMMDAALRAFFAFVGAGRQRTRIKCHHNFTEQESFGGRLLWITRKGAIKADAGRLGVIPGSMGTQSYIVEGKGSTLAWNSCAHGAGRAMSRSEAKRRFTTDDLIASMGDRVWLHSKADALLDEIPMAYKSIDAVMEDQKDLVEVKAVLRQVLNYKGA